jgi:hypothetical protein
MARPKSDRKAADSGSAFLRFSSPEFSVITRAKDLQARGVIGARSITTATYTREVVLRESLLLLIRDAIRPYAKGHTFDYDKLCDALGIADETMRYRARDVLTDMATRLEIGQNAAGTFIKR